MTTAQGPRWTDETEQYVADAFRHVDSLYTGAQADGFHRGNARALLGALAAAGQLLPPGVQARTQWGVRVVGGHVIDWPDEDAARADLVDRRADGHEAELVTRTVLPAHWTDWEVAR